MNGSEQMLAQVRERLADRLDRVTLVRADLRQPLHLGVQVVAVMSVAALHWVPGHAAVFASVARMLRPGGRFVAECAGLGNVANVRAAVAQVEGRPDPDRWGFSGVEDTTALLGQAGFVDVSVSLVDDTSPLEPGEQLEGGICGRSGRCGAG